MGKRHRKLQQRPQRVAKLQSYSSTLLDIVIPVFNRFDLLKICLESIPQAIDDITHNIIIVDNASKPEDADPFYDAEKQKFGNVLSIIRNKENKGFPTACNIGASRKTSPLILFLSSDIELFQDAIVNLITAIDDPMVGVVGAKLLFPEGTETGPSGKVQHVGMSSNIRGEFIHHLIGWSPENPKVLRIRKVLAVTGAVLLTRRNLWNKIGGFFEGYGMGTYEDVDYCLSVQSLGKEIIVEQTALGTHHVGASATGGGVRFPLEQNRLVLMSRWGGRYPWTELDAW